MSTKKLKQQTARINKFLSEKNIKTIRAAQVTDNTRKISYEKKKQVDDNYYPINDKRAESELKRNGFSLGFMNVVAAGNSSKGELPFSNDGTKGGILSGDKHSDPSGGIKAIIKETNEPVLLEDNEVVITAKAVENKKKFEFEGDKKTTKEILSDLNQAGGGVQIYAAGGVISSNNMKNGYVKLISKNSNLLGKLHEYEDFKFGDIEQNDILIIYTPDTQKYRVAYVKKVIRDLFILFDKARKQELTVSFYDILQQDAILFKKQSKKKYEKGGIIGATVIAKNRFSKVQELDRSQITTSPDDFQGREDKFAKETVAKIVNEGFDKSQDPIIVWYDEKKKKYIVISGHSRFEASEILYNNGDKDLQKMNVKIFLGDFDDAVEYAVIESNRSGTAESLTSDIRAYKLAKSKGYNSEKLKGLFKPESKLMLLKELAYLNENGKFLEHLGTPSEKSFPYLERNAKWIGNLRRMHGASLTDLHEKEMFDYFYTSKKGLDVKKENFFNYINGKVAGIYYDPTKLLGLNTSSRLTADSPAASELAYIRKMIGELNDERVAKEDLLRKFKHSGDTDKVAILQKRLTEINKALLLKHEKAAILESQIQKADNTPMPDLFSTPPAKATVKESTPEPKKEPTSDLKAKGRKLVRELQLLRDKVAQNNQEAKTELRKKVREMQEWRDEMAKIQ